MNIEFWNKYFLTKFSWIFKEENEIRGILKL